MAVLQWVGWIKDYDGGTLMECVINPKLPYTDFPTLVERQREALDRHIRTLSRSHVVHPGLTSFAADSHHHLSVSSIPGVWQAAAAACWAHHACAQGCVAAQETCSFACLSEASLSSVAWKGEMMNSILLYFPVARDEFITLLLAVLLVLAVLPLLRLNRTCPSTSP